MFLEKEKRLANFYQNKPPSFLHEFSSETLQSYKLALIICGWSVVIGLAWLWTVAYSWVIGYWIISAAITVYLTWFYGGIDAIQSKPQKTKTRQFTTTAQPAHTNGVTAHTHHRFSEKI